MPGSAISWSFVAEFKSTGSWAAWVAGFAPLLAAVEAVFAGLVAGAAWAPARAGRASIDASARARTVIRFMQLAPLLRPGELPGRADPLHQACRPFLSPSRAECC